MIFIIRVLMLCAVLCMVGIMVVYHVTAPANLAWLNGVR